MSELSQIMAAYIAGIVDGEGTIALYSSKRKSVRSQGGLTFIPQIQVANTDREWLEHIGRLSEVPYDIQAKPYENIRWKSHAYTLRFPPKSVGLLIPQIYPYLFVKKINAEVLMMHFEHGQKREDNGKGKFRSNEKFELAKYMTNVMHRLNSRGAGSKEAKELATVEFRKFRDEYKN